MVHRELKPENFFLKDWCVKLGDFGLSKVLKEEEGWMTSEKLGTPCYMAPEIITGESYSFEVDV